MSTRLKILIGGAFAILILFNAFLLYRYAPLLLRIAFAEEQTKIFEAMVVKSADSEPVEVIKSLEYVIVYYPSGSKQIHGSRLDRIVERSRRQSVARIIEILKAKTNEDLGDAPEAWIKKYKTDS